MIVKRRKKTSLHGLDSKKLAFIIFSAIFLWTVLLIGLFYFQSSHVSFNKIGRDLVGSAKAFALMPVNWSRANFAKQEIPKIQVNVDFLKRAKDLEKGVLKLGPEDSVQATITHNNRPVKVRLRLKGEKADIRKNGDEWSIRFKLKGDGNVLGMRRFTLQSPKPKSFTGSVLFLEALRREGLIVPRYFLVQVAFNGKEIGLMTLKEDLSKELLEAQGRKDSVIIRFNDLTQQDAKTGDIFNNFRVARISPFQPNRVALSKNLSSDIKIARGLLRAFANGLSPASQVFDPVLMGRYIAVAEMWGALDQLRWHQLRFYFNPITARLEPIGRQANILNDHVEISTPEDEPILSAMLQNDSEIRAVYQETLQKIGREMEAGETEKWSRPLAGKQLKILHKNYPYLPGVSFDLIARHANTVLTRTHPPLKPTRGQTNSYPEILQAFSINIEGSTYLDLINPLNFAVEIHEIKCVAPADGKDFKLSMDPSIDFPIYLDPTPRGGFPKIQKISYTKKKSAVNCEINVAAKTTEDDSLQWIKAIPYSPVLINNPVPQGKLSETLAQHPFLRFDANTNTIHVEPGEWDVDQWLVIPEGIELKVSNGTTMRFGKNYGLISRGPVTIKGTESAPVVLTGKGGKGIRNRWQGVAVLKTSRPSKWAHVIIRNTTGINLDGWNLSGGVNFYEADLIMNNVTLTGNRSEDALNIVRSKLELDAVSIKGTVANALDADFSNGSIRGGLYENIGRTKRAGDGINTRGSKITVDGTVFRNISSQALIVGENSVMTANDVSMDRVETGAVSKNGSSLTLTNAKIHQASFAGLVAYTKKTEYGPGTIVASNLEAQSVATQAIAHKGSLITIDGEKVVEVDETNLDQPSKIGNN